MTMRYNAKFTFVAKLLDRVNVHHEIWLFARLVSELMKQASGVIIRH